MCPPKRGAHQSPRRSCWRCLPPITLLQTAAVAGEQGWRSLLLRHVQLRSTLSSPDLPAVRRCWYSGRVGFDSCLGCDEPFCGGLHTDCFSLKPNNERAHQVSRSYRNNKIVKYTPEGPRSRKHNLRNMLASPREITRSLYRACVPRDTLLLF